MGPFKKIDRQEVIGKLKATGSRDKDVLYAAKMQLLPIAQLPKSGSIIVIIMGALVSLTIYGAVVGIPVVLLGFWMRRLAAKNTEILEAAYSEYIASM